MNGPTGRKIIHIDMDAFYAAVEQRDFPEYRGMPVVVGGAPNARGVVATCSYEARTFGIHSAMPTASAYRLCPHAIFLRPRFEAYRAVSRQVREILLQFTDLVEPVSLDEAYLDVTDSQQFMGSATLMAKEIKRLIHASTGLTASAGVSYNKFLAKIASDLKKPDGLHLIPPDLGPDFVESLAIGKFHGIGQKTEAKMQSLGIQTGKDLKQHSLEYLLEQFGKAGSYYYWIARGLDSRPVQPARPRLSWGEEETYQQDLDDQQEMLARLLKMAGEVFEKLKMNRLQPRTVTVKLRYSNFQLITRAKTLNQPILSLEQVITCLPELLMKTEAARRKVRLLGISFSNFQNESIDKVAKQMDLFED